MGIKEFLLTEAEDKKVEVNEVNEVNEVSQNINEKKADIVSLFRYLLDLKKEDKKLFEEVQEVLLIKNKLQRLGELNVKELETTFRKLITNKAADSYVLKFLNSTKRSDMFTAAELTKFNNQLVNMFIGNTTIMKESEITGSNINESGKKAQQELIDFITNLKSTNKKLYEVGKILFSATDSIKDEDNFSLDKFTKQIKHQFVEIAAKMYAEAQGTVRSKLFTSDDLWYVTDYIVNKYINGIKFMNETVSESTDAEYTVSEMLTVLQKIKDGQIKDVFDIIKEQKNITFLDVIKLLVDKEQCKRIPRLIEIAVSQGYLKNL